MVQRILIGLKQQSENGIKLLSKLSDLILNTGKKVVYVVSKAIALLKDPVMLDIVLTLFGVISLASIFAVDHWDRIFPVYKNIIDLLYFVASTITTTGYGELHPESLLGRFLFILGFLGIGSAAVRTVSRNLIVYLREKFHPVIPHQIVRFFLCDSQWNRNSVPEYQDKLRKSGFINSEIYHGFGAPSEPDSSNNIVKTILKITTDEAGTQEIIEFIERTNISTKASQKLIYAKSNKPEIIKSKLMALKQTIHIHKQRFALTINEKEETCLNVDFHLKEGKYEIIIAEIVMPENFQKDKELQLIKQAQEKLPEELRAYLDGHCMVMNEEDLVVSMWS